jgi:cytidine deaminase
MNKQLQARMLTAARRAAADAYAPYSGFKVGAAVLDERDRIHPGCNVENASFGLTICAERAAIARAVCSGAKSVKAVLVFTDTEQPTPPCGACLQAIAELSRDPEIILASRTKTKRLKLSDLLPQRFVLKRD